MTQDSPQADDGQLARRHGGYLCADINQRLGRIAVIARCCGAIERCQSQHFDAALDTLFHLMRQ